ncbi:MAG: phosphotransferase [Patescibacteria group bacterium]
MTEQVAATIEIGGKSYEHVKTREYTPVAIYKCDGEFLRIAPKEVLTPELTLHKKILSYGFPVPNILAEGELDGMLYYTEQSFGDKLLGDLFWEDCKQGGEISSEHFNFFLNVSEKFALAQLKTAIDDKDDEGFYMGIHVNDIIEELPKLETTVIAAFEKTKERTRALPTVLTHGDLNAHNMFQAGIIDLGSTHTAPAGYDLIGNIYHTYNFPKTGEYESMRRYDFTANQISEYLRVIDAIYTESGLPRLIDFKDDFIFAKSVWSTVRMYRYPKLKKWRQDRFKKILVSYLNGQPLAQIIFES